jgi:CheY-like chemotaxis protein
LSSQESATILLIGNDLTLGYLLKRYAEHSGYRLEMNAERLSSHEIEAIGPAVIIFLSTERLARDQDILQELSSPDMPIVVCSSVVEESRAIELGADYCLLHPLTYDDFQAALAYATASRHV